MAVTDDDVKTRAQKEKLDEIEAEKPQVSHTSLLRTRCCAPSGIFHLLTEDTSLSEHSIRYMLPSHNPLVAHYRGNSCR